MKLKISRRLIILLIIFAIVGYAGLTIFTNRYEATNWQKPLIVTIFAINQKADPAIDAYVKHVRPAQFQETIQFLQTQAEHYGIHSKPIITLQMGSEIKGKRPPEPPKEGNNIISNLIWNLSLRYWAYKHAHSTHTQSHINVFILYQKLTPHKQLPHSFAIQSGYTAVVNAFADPNKRSRNNVVFAHELLHTIGATDKYNHKLLPLYPDGYAYPNEDPLYPQDKCEIMAPYILSTALHAKPAQQLQQCIVGPQTAHEIGWW